MVDEDDVKDKTESKHKHIKEKSDGNDDTKDNEGNDFVAEK